MAGLDSSDRIPYGRSIADDLLHSGTRFGDYEIVSIISVTLFGAYYYALDHRHDEEVCIQVMPRFFSNDSRSISRIETQIRILQNLAHPNILRPSHVERVDSMVVIVYDPTDYIAATDYLFLNTQGNGLPEDMVRKILTKAGSALEAAKEQKVSHSNLTPENMLLGPDGELLITGFGILESLDRERFELFVSTAITPIKENSSRCYYTALEVLSPEFRNKLGNDIRGDMYALGVVTCFLLSGKKLDNPLLDLADFRPDLASGWKVVIQRCLEEKPELRYATIAALQSDLQRLREIKIIPVKQPPWKSFLGLLRSFIKCCSLKIQNPPDKPVIGWIWKCGPI
jgi:eukaryotic-like serine/threonine-protein kinase